MRRLLTIAVCLTLGLCLRAGNRDDAELKFKGIGDFNDPALHSTLCGSYLREGSEGPDILIKTDKFYGNHCLIYDFVKYDGGVPVFKRGKELPVPEEAKKGNLIFRQKGEKLYMFWDLKGKLHCQEYIFKKDTFKDVALMDMPKGASIKALDFKDSGELDFYYTKADKVSARPGNWRAADYRPYDAAGVYRGGLDAQSLWRFSYPTLGAAPTEPELISEREAIPGAAIGMDILSLNGEKGIVISNRDGGFYFFRLTPDGKTEKVRIADNKGNAMRHVTINPLVMVYPSPTGDLTGMLVSCEGGLFYMRYTGRQNAEGKYIYDNPVNAKEVNPALNAGSLVTPTAVDWDNDGRTDLIVGNSAGHILYFRNIGTDENPDFLKAEYLKAGGRTIHIQPGYGEDVQGPGEARWGYIGANAYDWNGDGYLDILTNDSRGKHMVFIGTANGLEPEHPIYLGDLPLHGTWRCRPGIGVLDGKTVYITLDDDDDFHLYFREDDYNLTDGGKLLLSDGRNIKANWLEAGGKGRVRFEITDWDGDGVKDLIVSTNKHNMIPAQDADGLPWSHPDELKGATILFMRNVGTEAAPRLEKPRQLHYKGELLRLGHHGCCGTMCYFGHISDGMPNIVAGDETGTLYLFERQYISW